MLRKCLKQRRNPMSNYIYLDLETIPSQRNDIKDHFAKNITPPGNIKKPESIEKWNQTEKPKAIEKVLEKTSLNGTFGEIIQFNLAINDNNPVIFQRKLDESEHDLIMDFTQWLNPLDDFDKTPVLVGHNIKLFDLKFLHQRMIVNKIVIPSMLRFAIKQPKYSSELVYDTMLEWAGYERDKYENMDTLCLALNIPTPKNQIDGSEIWATVQAGKYDILKQYGIDEIVALREVHRRMVNQ